MEIYQHITLSMVCILLGALVLFGAAFLILGTIGMIQDFFIGEEE